ncbi:MAG TPA: hypothetical protein VF334_10910 [Polyangia bacterium]
MTQRGAVILAAALTAFVLVVAGGVAGRLSRPEPPAASAPAAPPWPVVAARPVVRRAPAPRPAVWREHEREHEHDHDEHEDDDD